MDAKRTRDLVFLGVLSLLCATVAGSGDHVVFGAVFYGLGLSAVLSAAFPRPRR
jgi:hypothetical protein